LNQKDGLGTKPSFQSWICNHWLYVKTFDIIALLYQGFLLPGVITCWHNWTTWIYGSVVE